MEKNDSLLARSSLEWIEEERVVTHVEELTPSPLLPMVDKDRAQISEENLAIKDR